MRIPGWLTDWRMNFANCAAVSPLVLAFAKCMQNQVWHRGAPNTSDRTRYITQISYASRLVGHKFYPFMDYTLPDHVKAAADGGSEQLRRLLGFLPRGAYG